MEKNHIAILICMNDITFQKGTTNNGIKSNLSYFEQLLMLCYSIQENWTFSYDIYVIHCN